MSGKVKLYFSRLLKSFKQGYLHKAGDYRSVARLKNAKGKFRHNIHDELNPKKYANQFLGVHYGLKYKLVYPAILTLDFFFGKLKKNKVPKNEPNYLLWRFNKAYDLAVRKWVKYYVHKGNMNAKSKTYITKRVKGNTAAQLLLSIKQWFITILLCDQAYKEFFNIFTLEYAKELQKELKGRKVNHLLYDAKVVDDVAYFQIIRQIQQSYKVGMHDESEQTKNRNSTDKKTE